MFEHDLNFNVYHVIIKVLLVLANLFLFLVEYGMLNKE
jgi:hypothetical protein